MCKKSRVNLNKLEKMLSGKPHYSLDTLEGFNSFCKKYGEAIYLRMKAIDRPQAKSKGQGFHTVRAKG